MTQERTHMVITLEGTGLGVAYDYPFEALLFDLCQDGHQAPDGACSLPLCSACCRPAGVVAVSRVLVSHSPWMGLRIDGVAVISQFCPLPYLGPHCGLGHCRLKSGHLVLKPGSTPSLPGSLFSYLLFLFFFPVLIRGPVTFSLRVQGFSGTACRGSQGCIGVLGTSRAALGCWRLPGLC